MRKSTMNLQDFWERCTVRVYNKATGERITSDFVNKYKDLEVIEFDPYFDNVNKTIGIEIVLEKKEWQIYNLLRRGTTLSCV